jgi:hypothetical protein
MVTSARTILTALLAAALPAAAGAQTLITSGTPVSFSGRASARLPPSSP